MSNFIYDFQNDTTLNDSQKESMKLIMTKDSLTDALGTITQDELSVKKPEVCPEIKNATPLTQQLWKVAFNDIEYNLVKMSEEKYFGAGTSFGMRMFVRDICYSGVLGLNRFYTDVMRQSLKLSRRLRKEVRFRVPTGFAIEDINVQWKEEDIDFVTLHNETTIGLYDTDDIVWLWCAGDLADKYGNSDDWEWIYAEGEYFFNHFYMPFYDETDGLFRGQATYIDVHFHDHKTTGYPLNWITSDCVLIKATSTNCLYYKGMKVMEEAALKLGKTEQAKRWGERAQDLKNAIIKQLRRSDGTFEYYKDRWGELSSRREVLGSAFVVLFGIVEGDEAVAALKDYPITDSGIPVFHPYFRHDFFYHNNTSWPFTDTFFIKALEKADGKDRTALNAALLARTCRKAYVTDWSRKPAGKLSDKPLESDDGASFHEVVHFPSKKITCSSHQLWSAASFVDTCIRAGLV